MIRDPQLSQSASQADLPDGGSATGGVISNTPPLSSQWVAAEDWLDVCFYVEWDLSKWKPFCERLEECKIVAGSVNPPEELTGWQDGKWKIEVDPVGARFGGPKGIYCKWKFTVNELIGFRMTQRSEAHKTQPNVSVNINGRACTLEHAATLYQSACEFIRKMGGEIQENKVSRVDFCLDMPGVPMDEFIQCFREERFLCRANYLGQHRSKGVTLVFGSSSIVCRIYDKLAEVMLKADPIKTLAMCTHRWHCDAFPSCATRVEFQLRRECLKARGVNGFADYEIRRASLAEYLTTEWLRLTSDVIDRVNKNQSRAKTLKLWRDVQNALIEWGEGSDAPLVPLDSARADVAQLIRQGVGSLLKAAELKGLCKESPEFLDELIAWVKSDIRRRG